jgi:hypothetical protein
MEEKINKEVIEKVKEYAYKHYPNKYGKKDLMVEERDNHFRVKSNKDESPLILGKSIIN